MPRGKKNTPAPLRAKKDFRPREERFPPRREDHIAVLAGTWVDPNESAHSAQRDSASPSQRGQKSNSTQHEGVAGRRSRDYRSSYSFTSQASYHYTAETLVGKRNIPTPSAAEQFSWEPPVDPPASRTTYHYTADKLVEEKNVPDPADAEKSCREPSVDTYSIRPACDHPGIIYSPPEQPTTVEPDTPPEEQPTPPGYHYTKETLEDKYRILPPSHDKQQAKSYDDGFEEITVVRFTTQVYKVRCPTHITQQFRCSPDGAEEHKYEGHRQSEYKSTFGHQYYDDRSHTPRYHNHTSSSKERDSQDTSSTRPNKKSRPYPGGFHVWVDEFDEATEYQQPEQNLSNEFESQYFDDEINPMDSKSYRGKRCYEDFEEDEDDSFYDTGSGHGSFKKKSKRHAY